MRRYRKTLMVTLRYPPSSSTGIIRTLKYQKYLPEFGWIADTLTGLHPGGASKVSEEPAHEGPGKTYRIAFPDFFDGAGRHVEHRGQSPNQASRRAVSTALRRFAAYLLLPDSQALFAPAAFLRSEAFVRQSEVVYASGMPWSGLVAAAMLVIRTPRPLVLDLRDPWIEPGGVRHDRFRNFIETLIEGATLTRASAVVVTAHGLREDLLRRRPSLAGRVHVLPNGYDEEDFQGPPALPLGPFDVIHTGIFYGTKGPSDLFAGVRIWLTQHPRRRRDVRLRLVGPVRSSDREAALQHGLGDVVVFEPPVPHREAVARLRAARVAVAVDFGPIQAKTRVLSKVFEYMRSGKPLLFLSSGGDTEAILRTCPRAVIVRKDDPQAVADALERIASRPAPPEEFRPEPYTLSFERRVLAGRLAELLAQVCHPLSAPLRTPQTTNVLSAR